MTDKSDDITVGHLNAILARGGGNLNDPIIKSSQFSHVAQYKRSKKETKVIWCTNIGLHKK